MCNLLVCLETKYSFKETQLNQPGRKSIAGLGSLNVLNHEWLLFFFLFFFYFTFLFSVFFSVFLFFVSIFLFYNNVIVFSFGI